IRELLQRYSPEVIRFFVLQKHYRSPLDYTEEGIQHAKNNLERLYNTLENIRIALEKAETPFRWDKEEFELYEVVRDARKKFYEAMDDDFNTAEAMKPIFEVANAVNRYLERVERPKESVLRKALEFFKMISEVFGIFEDYFKEAKETKEEELIELLVEVRSALRKQKNFELADKIRSELRELGIQLEDTPQGTIWKRINV
ncbi:MAG TPA: cysteine--tRNA ligase, partial [Thermococcaceae archaeon]|nr:cysteine--tRNA ligase [Thermococcaceae archaeon]